MSVLTDLVNQIDDVTLRERILKEVTKLAKQKKFGLVFEEHMPECTPLYDMPIKAGTTVAKRAGSVNDIYKVLRIQDGMAACVHKESQETCTIDVAELVAVAEFGESIYPYLKLIDSVCNAPDSDLWHTLIEADNYHALQLLEYLYAGKVDCIYIDPPYNTGARDWKYNNDYVDGNDTYRHSKWLSFMEKRLRLAKKLLNPNDSALIITIDEKEYLHLGCLLEEMFPEAQIQMVSSVINPAGVSRNNQFARTNEYIYYVFMGVCRPVALELDSHWIGEIKSLKRKQGLRWNTLIRSGTDPLRTDCPNLFYPIFVTADGKRVVSVGDPYYGDDRNEVIAPVGCLAIWPIRSTGEEGRWQVSKDSLISLLDKGYVKLGRFNDRGTMAIDYLKRGEISKIEDGTFSVVGRTENGTVIVDDSEYTPRFVPGCQWNIPSHDATQQGTKILNAIIGTRFSFPKSLYAVHDAIRFLVAEKPNALIVDFFAGSGTTLHAINLLNAEDGGNRRCIMVTNNEVSVDEAKDLSARGYSPGDPEWNALGIARYVTWPRTVCSIKGHDINCIALKGNYLGSDIPMANGFKANAAFFQLSFLNKTAVALGMTFKEMLPTFWMKAGAVGRCPTLDGTAMPNMLVLPENKFAVLVNENAFSAFTEELAKHPEIQTVFLTTDYDINYRSMVKNLNVQNTYQLYRDYLDHFRLNRGRS